eukprot:scaffold104583_cov19-Tisochrysis_lutea.AAC.4
MQCHAYYPNCQIPPPPEDKHIKDRVVVAIQLTPYPALNCTAECTCRCFPKASRPWRVSLMSSCYAACAMRPGKPAGQKLAAVCTSTKVYCSCASGMLDCCRVCAPCTLRENLRRGHVLPPTPLLLQGHKDNHMSSKGTDAHLFVILSGTQGSYSGASPFGAMEGGGQADLPAEEARLQKLRALAQSPLENVNRSMLVGAVLCMSHGRMHEGKSNQQEEQDRSTGRMAPAGASSGQGSPRAPSPAELRMGSSKEAGPGPGSVSSGRGAFSREGGFSFPALEGDGGALVQREHGKEGSERGERAFGHPSRGSGAWLDEALGRTPSSPRAAGAAGTPFSQSMHQQHGSSQSDTQPPRSSLRQRGFLAEEGLGDSRGGARGAGGAGSGAGRLRMATTSGSNATVSYNALLDSKARKRGALMASGVVWARNQELNPAPSLRQCLTFEEIARLRAHQRSGENAGGLISSLSSRPSTAPAL